MRIAYVTFDPVNQDLAEQMAAARGVELYSSSGMDHFPELEFHAVIYDLDYLFPEQRRAVLDQLLAGPPGRPVAVHSFNLEEREAAGLRRNGVAVFRSLEPSVLTAVLPKRRGGKAARRPRTRRRAISMTSRGQ